MVDFKKLCRACNSEKSNLLNFHSNDEELTLGEMYISITLLELNELDGLPQHICYPCAKKLEAAFSFQKSCQKNEKQLQKLYEKSHQNKESDNSDKSNIPHVDLVKNFKKLERRKDINTIQHLPQVEPTIFKWGNESIEKEINEPPKKLQRLSTKLSDIGTTEKQQLLCDECDKKFFTIAALTLHKKLHKKNKNNPDPEIIQSEKLLMQAKLKKFQCKFCETSFNELIFLRNHLFQFHEQELISNSNQHSEDDENTLLK